MIKLAVTIFAVLFLLNSMFGEEIIIRSELTKLGEKEYAKANYDKALKLFKYSIAEGAKTGIPWFFSGLILETKRKYRESIMYYTKAVERPLEKQYQEAAFWKIILYLEQTGDYAQLLEYSDRLKTLIGENKRLEEIILNAELNATPVHIEARKRIKEGEEIEVTYLPKRKENFFWTKYRLDIKKVAEIYEMVAPMHERYQNLAWKAASYYEHLELFDDALRVYQWIANQKNDPKVNYKFGVILRKQNKYRDSEEYLNAVINSEDAPKKIKYYAIINISQVYYGYQNFSRAEENVKKALNTSFTKFRTKYQKEILYLIRCNSSLQLSGIMKYQNEKKIMSSLKEGFRACYSFVKKNAFLEKSRDYSLITLANLVYAKWFHLVSETNLSLQKKYIELALEHYTKAFLYSLPQENIEEKGQKDEVIEKEIQVGVSVSYQKNHPGPKKETRVDWCLGELEEVVFFIAEVKKYDVLNKFVLEYTDKLQVKKDYPVWLANSYFHIGNYEQAYLAYQNIRTRSVILEEKLLLSFANLQRWEYFEQEVKNYIYAFMDAKNEIISFLTSESTLSKYRKKENFSMFLAEINKIGE